MALKKKTTLQNGFECEYWKVTAVRLDKQKFTIDASIGLFRSKQFADKTQVLPEKSLAVKFTIAKEKAGDDLIKLVYDYVNKILSKELVGSKFDPNGLIFSNLENATKE